MRLERLNLEFFGHFSDKQFDFGSRKDSGHDFHVIFGPNEAGKTTVMEAYLRLLYGFPNDEKYGFQHQRKNLRVSGTLEIDQQRREFTRLPTRTQSLLDQNGQVVSESALQSHLGGLSMVDYRKLLCMDDDSIELGGEEIVNSKGDIGALLFSAAAGIGDLSGVLNNVESQANQLYRRRATKTRFAGLKKEHADVDKQIRELDVSASGYRKLKQAHERALAAEQVVGAERKELNEQQLMLKTLIEVRPVLVDIEELDNKIEPFESYPRDLAITPENIEALLITQSKASNDIERLESELATLRSMQHDESYHTEHLDLEDGLNAIDTLRSLALVAEHGLEKQRRVGDDLLADMQRAGKDLNVHADADCSTLILPSSTLQELQHSRQLLLNGAQSVASEQQEVNALQETVDVLSAEADRLESDLPADAGLEELLRRFSVDSLMLEHARAQQMVDRADQEYRQALDELSRKGQQFESIPRCTLSSEEVEEIVTRIQEVSQMLESAGRERDALASERAVLASQIVQYKATDGLLDDEDAQELKKLRDARWTEHKAALSMTTAREFEMTMQAMDHATDTRLMQAKDIGELRQVEQVHAQKEATWGVVSERIASLESAKEDAESALIRCASECGLQDRLSPKALLTWVRKLEVAQGKSSACRQLTTQFSTVFERAQRLKAALADHVTLEGSDVSDEVAAAKALIEQRNAQLNTLNNTRERLDESQHLLNNRQSKLDALEKAQANALDSWQTLVQVTFTGLIPEAALRFSLQPLYELRELDKERSAILRTIAGMEHDQHQFSRQVEELSERSEIEQKKTPLETYEFLRQLNDKAQEEKKAFDAVLEKIKDMNEQLSAARQEVSDVHASVRGMGELFPRSITIETVSQLRRAVSDALEADRYRAQKASLELQVLRALDAQSIGEVRATLENRTESELKTELAEVEARLKVCEEEYTSSIEQRASAKKELDTITGDADIALLDQKRTALVLEMTEVAMEYLKLDAGLRLATEAIRRYRDAHRSVMMKVTESTFTALTNGAYVKLQTQAEGAVEVLKAVDGNGTPKAVNDMSKGTRFQMYLALRAAAYEQLCSDGTCLPFVCDDIFETFDEKRTRSACQVLDRIGQTGQAIYLTHHQHVVDIARDVCGENVIIHSIN